MFGGRLRTAMELRGYSQGMLEARTKHLGRRVSQSNISRMLHDEILPTLDKAAVLADALEVSLDWLAGRTATCEQVQDPGEQALLAAYRSMSRSASRAALSGIAASMAAAEKQKTE
jgi:transcriptional regulator with XRE-family HTH domain